MPSTFDSRVPVRGRPVLGRYQTEAGCSASLPSSSRSMRRALSAASARAASPGAAASDGVRRRSPKLTINSPYFSAR